mmetsp:Transcript_45578/g.115798  ORF Transcript_45578/g.115798 Transcript_45578/m.115798 type:complete len:152 (-) Transcript_45578:196-651(-)
MWHLNIPIFRNLHKVAEHERHAVLALAQTWWGFADNLPRTLKLARVNGLVPLLPPPESDLRKVPQRAPAALAALPPRARDASLASSADARSSGLESVDVAFEVMRMSAQGAGSKGLPGSYGADVVVEDGFLRPVRKSSSGSPGIFRVLPGD